MMQRGKLMSSAGLTRAKNEINDALNELEAGPSNAQSVYTNLTNIYNTLADHPRAQLVDSRLAFQQSVELLRDLVRLHLREEEVQWVLGRVLALACQASIRFQCQAGQLEMWNELFEMRSTHPQSIRVLEASLQASESLFRSHEFNATKLRPLLLLDDLVNTMDRFLRVEAATSSRENQIAVLTLRVLLALYSSPRSTDRLLFNGESSSQGGKWVSEILRRMLNSFVVLLEDIGTICSWLDMVVLLLRQYPAQTLDGLFSARTYKMTSWWFIAVIERWQPQALVMNALFTIATYVFALPHNTLGDHEQAELAERLITEQKLLDVVCSVVQHYHNETMVPLVGTSTEGTTSDAKVLVLLEAIRLVRQWSERPTLLLRLEVSRSVESKLLPVLTEQLHLHARQSPLSLKQLVFVLEILLILRHLAASLSLRHALESNNLLPSLKGLRSSSIKPSAGDDGELHALVAREVQELHKLFANGPDVAPKLARLTRHHNQPSATAIVTRRKLHVKQETLQAYDNK